MPASLTIAIAGATGNIGSRVARQVAAQGATPLLLGQSLGRLQALGVPGARCAVADLTQPAQVVAATQGADALLWLVPPTLTAPSLHGWYAQITQAGLAAVERNQLRRVVLVSTVGVSTQPGRGTVTYAGHLEEAFARLPARVNVLALRPGYFLENLLLQAPRLHATGEFGFPFAPTHAIPFLSTDDIGDEAARYLLSEQWAGHWQRNLLGPENLTLAGLAQRLTVLIGRPIRYRQDSLADTTHYFGTLGANPVVQQEMAELFTALGDPQGIYATPRTPEATTPTTLEQFAHAKLLPLLGK